MDAMLDVEIEIYSQDRFLADCEGEEGRRVPHTPRATHPDHSQTTPTAASPKEERCN